ncbi:ATP-binding protein [Streptomyces sp. NPDC093109]|uniref:sensor histidine kinase n=1 Tax=Streptomyces sp. NPDC093109 TaxID=3154977 RepID=UPI00344F0962
MSHLRAPVARPERREGGRHGRPGSRSLSSLVRTEPTAPPDTRIRPQLMRTAVLPAIVAALSGATAVVVVLRTTAAEPTAEIWTALFGTALLALAAVAAAALGAERTAKSLLGRGAALRRSHARGQAELRAVMEQLRRGEPVTVRRAPPAGPGPGPGPDSGVGAGVGEEDEFDLLAREMARSQAVAVGAVVQASRLSSSVGNEQKVEVFVNLARRLQSLVHREIQLLDELENQVEDPELLKGLFHVDHLATRIRRHAENLAVLGGAVSRRQWSRPVAMTEVLRSAIAEVEQYPRIKLVPPIDGTLRGHAVADVIHLLAELVENATLFSSPHTQVLLRAQHVTAGLAIEVEDRGLGMPIDEQKRMNSLLTDPDQVNVAHLLQDGRIGLFVVSALARRHGIAVRLQSNIYGGVQAVLVLPQTLLGSDRTEQGERGAGRPAAPAVPPPPATAPPVPSVPPAVPRRSAPPRPSPQLQPPPVSPPMSASASASRPPRQASAPAPLPVRGEHAREGDGDGTIESAGSRPRLPRRRGQEHLVPQLRDTPAPPPAGEPTLHDPGLMAAFQRGIGLAESQPAPGADTRHEHPAGSLPEPQRRDNTPTTKE